MRRLRATAWLFITLLLAPFVGSPLVEMERPVGIDQAHPELARAQLHRSPASAEAEDRAARTRIQRLDAMVVAGQRDAAQPGLTILDVASAPHPAARTHDLRRDLLRRGYEAQGPPAARRA